jgi:hypothetical protein
VGVEVVVVLLIPVYIRVNDVALHAGGAQHHRVGLVHVISALLFRVLLFLLKYIFRRRR